MKQTIIMVFVCLTAYGLSSSDSAQQPTGWTNPYFYYHYNAQLDLPTQKVSADGKAGNQQQLFTNYNDHSMQNTLGSHVVLLTTCLRDLKSTKADLVHTHSEVENVKKELNKLKENPQFNSTSTQLMANVMATVENMKKEMTGMVHKDDVQIVKKELANVMTTVENMKKDTSASGAASSIGRIPQTCDDLQKIGHRKSGLFSVMGNKTVDNVYCDFTKPINDAGFQKLIGHVDVKATPIYFYAQRSSDFKTPNTVVPFDLLRLNVGNAMNTNGVFVAPTSGKYFFTFSGVSDRSNVRLDLQLKTATVDWSRITQGIGTGEYQTCSLQSTLQLAKGDQIRLILIDGILHDHAHHYTNFVGQLLEEDILH